MNNSFQSLKIDSRLTSNLEDLKFLEMTLIQQESLPIILEGEDIIAQTKTGVKKACAMER
ncbi:hypothetical protein [Halobacteriovorax sp.]|uniref:hypothetical protein n=1 Tax=Halobacteriovorax sp. TaxID=2020862 RepID=UPI003AF2D699